jgi:hypothetical protein
MYTLGIVKIERKKMNLVLIASRDGEETVMGSFDSMDEAMEAVFALDEEGEWEEGCDAELLNSETGEKYFFDGDCWSPVNY